jgi:plastocyanin
MSATRREVRTGAPDRRWGSARQGRRAPLGARLAVGLSALFAACALEPHPSLGDTKAPPVFVVGGSIEGALPIAPIVVFLDGARQPGKKPLTHRLGQKGLRFTPEFLLVAQGDTVAFPNDDRVTHNVFSISRAKKFDLDLYPPGSFRQIVFDEAGLVDIFCSIHQNMHAVIVVAPSDYAVVADPVIDGGSAPRPPGVAFRIPSVPAGRYAVVAWQKGKEIAREPVVVAGHDVALTLTPRPTN